MFLNYFLLSLWLTFWMHTSVTDVLLLQESHTQYVLILIPLITLCHSAHIFQSSLFFFLILNVQNGMAHVREGLWLLSLPLIALHLNSDIPALDLYSRVCHVFKHSVNAMMNQISVNYTVRNAKADWQHRRNNPCLTCNVIISLMLNMFQCLNVSVLIPVPTI